MSSKYLLVSPKNPTTLNLVWLFKYRSGSTWKVLASRPATGPWELWNASVEPMDQFVEFNILQQHYNLTYLTEEEAFQELL